MHTSHQHEQPPPDDLAELSQILGGMIRQVLGPRAGSENLYALVVFLEDRELLVSDAGPGELARALRELAENLDPGKGSPPGGPSPRLVDLSPRPCSPRA